MKKVLKINKNKGILVINYLKTKNSNEHAVLGSRSLQFLMQCSIINDRLQKKKFKNCALY